MDESEARQRLASLLASQSLGVLATSDGEQTHATLIAFSVSEDLGRIAFATSRASRKYRMLSMNPRVAMLVDDRSNEVCDFRDAVAATARGSAREVAGAEREALEKHYLAKHPHLREFVHAPSCALVAISVAAYDLVSHFQDVSVLVVDDADASCSGG